MIRILSRNRMAQLFESRDILVIQPVSSRNQSTRYVLILVLECRYIWVPSRVRYRYSRSGTAVYAIWRSKFKFLSKFRFCVWPIRISATRVSRINHSGPADPPRYCAQTVRKGAHEPIQMSQGCMQCPAALWAIIYALGEMNRRVFASVPMLNKPQILDKI